MIPPRSVDELMFHMGAVAKQASSDWERGFAASIVKQSRRRNWKPSEKQVGIMRRLVSEMFSEPEDLEVFE